MSIEARCPGCGKVIDAPDTAAGRRAQCPHCETVVDIPSRSGAGVAGPADPAGILAEALSRSATPSPSRGSATTVDRIFARTSPYRSLRVMAVTVFVLGIGVGALVFLAGLAALIILSMRGSPLVGVAAFVAGVILAGILIFYGKVLNELLRLAADVGDRTRQITQYIEKSVPPAEGQA